MSLDAFLIANRDEIIDRCRAKVGARRAPRPNPDQLERGIPLFLEQLIETLRVRGATHPHSTDAATRHGSDLMRQGFTVAQVVHDYGDVCQSVTELAIELEAPITNDDFRTLNRCLDDAIADATTEFFRLRELGLADEGYEKKGIFVHELRNLLSSASLAFEVLKSGSVGPTGATGAVLERSLAGIRMLVDRSLTEVRLDIGQIERERIEVVRLLQETEIAASLDANAKGIHFSVEFPTEKNLAVEGDSQILSSLVVNLVQNAVKFSRPDGHVVLSARATPEHIQIDVADECGGLPPGSVEELFVPFLQLGKDRSGLGLGLLIARRGADANGGEIRVRDLPGTGCVFTVELPRVP